MYITNYSKQGKEQHKFTIYIYGTRPRVQLAIRANFVQLLYVCIYIYICIYIYAFVIRAKSENDVIKAKF